MTSAWSAASQSTWAGDRAFEQVTERYLDTVRFRHNELIEPTRWHADLVINGTLDANKGTEIAACYLQNRLQAQNEAE